MSHKKRGGDQPESGAWIERYVTTGARAGLADELVRVTVELPRTVLEAAKAAAADQKESLNDLLARAVDSEVRALVFAHDPPRILRPSPSGPTGPPKGGG